MSAIYETEVVHTPGNSIETSIERLLVDYCHSLDDGEFERWPSFFSPDAEYRITTRENVENGYPLAIVYCEGTGMMEDRIRAMKVANIFEEHVYCHLLGRPSIREESAGLYRVRSNFVVYRTMYTGETEVFANGKYLDLVRVDAKGVRFEDRQVILDSRRVDTLLVIPL